MSCNDEQTLIDLTNRLKNQYQELGEIVQAIEQDSSRSVDSISDQMELIKKTEATLQPLRSAYQEANSQSSESVQQATDEAIDVVKTLMPKLASLEKASVESLRRLFPKIQGSVRAVQMKNAYNGNRQ